jgi:hypothetical protein
MIKKSYLAIFLIGVMTFTGCELEEKSKASVESSNNKKEANRENFKKILNNYNSRHCAMIEESSFPKEYPKSVGARYDRLEALEKVGLLNSTPVKTTKGLMPPATPEIGKQFTLSEMGKKFYTKHQIKMHSYEGFCIGNYKVEKITNFTKPTEKRGYTISKVKYTKKLTNISSFIPKLISYKNDIDLHSYLNKGDLNKTINEVYHDKAVLILTEMKGWVHKGDFEK